MLPTRRARSSTDGNGSTALLTGGYTGPAGRSGGGQQQGDEGAPRTRLDSSGSGISSIGIEGLSTSAVPSPSPSPSPLPSPAPAFLPSLRPALKGDTGSGSQAAAWKEVELVATREHRHDDHAYDGCGGTAAAGDLELPVGSEAQAPPSLMQRRALAARPASLSLSLSIADAEAATHATTADAPTPKLAGAGGLDAPAAPVADRDVAVGVYTPGHRTRPSPTLAAATASTTCGPTVAALAGRSRASRSSASQLQLASSSSAPASAIPSNVSSSPLLLLGASLLCFAGGMFGLGAMGELPFMYNNLTSSSSWQFPAVLLYLGGFGLIGGMVTWSTWLTSHSRVEIIISSIIVGILGLVYAGPFLLAAIMGVPVESLTFHPHHWMLGAHVALLLRAPDPLVCVLRWLMFGVVCQGIAAYGPSSLLSS